MIFAEKDVWTILRALVRWQLTDHSAPMQGGWGGQQSAS